MTVDELLAHRNAGRKWCRTCTQWLPQDDFGIDRSRADGKKHDCRDYERAGREGPSRAVRIAQKALGLTWCPRCADWVRDGRNNLCRAHRNEVYRERYAADGATFRARVSPRSDPTRI